MDYIISYDIGHISYDMSFIIKQTYIIKVILFSFSFRITVDHEKTSVKIGFRIFFIIVI